MEKIRNMSIRKTIIFYVCICLVLSFFISAVINQVSVRTQAQIWARYADESSESESLRVPDRLMSKKDAALSQLCDFLQTWTILLLSVSGSILAVFLLYHNKIKVPLEELEQGSHLISENELDFCISYRNRDELGRLCGEFEKMRAQLEENNRKMWEMMEQEKALRHAVAHDIRTPLSILKGNQEMMLDFIPQGVLDEEQILEMLRAGGDQIRRLEDFADTISRQAALEERKMNYQNLGIDVLEKALHSSARNITAGSAMQLTFRCEVKGQEIMADSFLIQEVAENLLANAARYANSRIDVNLDIQNSFLVIWVQDDGSGFREDMEKLTQAYYHANPENELKHFGLGLYICRVYCEKHGGKLILSNTEQGGACAAAYFKLKNR